MSNHIKSSKTTDEGRSTNINNKKLKNCVIEFRVFAFFRTVVVINLIKSV